MQFQLSNNRQPTNPQVAERLLYFQEHGAIQVADTFTAAGEDEAEFVFEGHRYIIAPRDDHYDRYVHALDTASAPFVKPDPDFSDNEVIVGVISRDARLLPQVMRSKQPKDGETLALVFKDMGRTIASIIKKSKVAPIAGSLALDRILVLRDESRVLLPPSVDFEQISDGTEDYLASQIEDQLLPVYEKFGGRALLQSFKVGLYDGDSRN